MRTCRVNGWLLVCAHVELVYLWGMKIVFVYGHRLSTLKHKFWGGNNGCGAFMQVIPRSGPYTINHFDLFKFGTLFGSSKSIVYINHRHHQPASLRDREFSRSNCPMGWAAVTIGYGQCAEMAEMELGTIRNPDNKTLQLFNYSIIDIPNNLARPPKAID